MAGSSASQENDVGVVEIPPPENALSRSLLLATALAIVLLTAIFSETVSSIVQIWMVSDLFGHGFLIVPIAAWLIWKRWPRILSSAPRRSWTGVLAIAALSVIWLLGDIADVNLVRQAAFVVMIPALVLAILGWTMFRMMVFPLGYLMLAVPFGEFLVAPLQDVTAVFVVKALQLTGIPVYIDGIYLQTPTGNFLVAEACSGARFLISTFAIGVLVSDLFYRSWARRLLFMLVAILVPIVANGLRAYGIVMIAHLVDPGFAASADHVTFGLIFMSIVTVLMILIGLSFRERSIQEYEEEVGASLPVTSVGSRRPLASMVAGSAGLTITVMVTLFGGHVQAVNHSEVFLNPIQVQMELPWQEASQEISGWQPSFVGADFETFQNFNNGDRSVVFYLGYYAFQREGAELINAYNNVVGGPWGRAGSRLREVVRNGQSFKVNQVRMLPKRFEGNQIDAQGRIVWYWYWINGQLTADPLRVKLLEVKSVLFGNDRSVAVIAIAADYRETPSEAVETLLRAFQLMLPIDRALKAAGGDVHSQSSENR